MKISTLIDKCVALDEWAVYFFQLKNGLNSNGSLTYAFSFFVAIATLAKFTLAKFPK